MRAVLCIVMRVRHSFNHFVICLLFVVASTLAMAQDAAPAPPCHAGAFARTLGRDGKTELHGLAVAPREMFRPRNLAWELPAAAATGLLIAYGDRRTADHFNSPSSEANWSRASDVAIAAELGAGGIAWIAGCASDHPSMAEKSFTALAAAGYGQVLNLGMKEIFRRQYPYSTNSKGKFFDRSTGGSFTSGHATTSFAFAAAIAKEYPHKPWVKWGSYAIAAGLSAARLPAKKHYPSDILVGAVVGWASGTYLADHASPQP